MQKILPELRQLGAEALVVSFAPPGRVAAYLAKYPQPFPVVSDPERSGYQAFGLSSTSVGAMLRPGVIARYLMHIFRGWLPDKRAEGEDIMQLGGDFLLDGAGVLRFAHPSAEPTDRPSAAELMKQARALTSAGVE